MKPNKYIVFAHPKTHGQVEGDNFIEQILKKDYGEDGNSNAIGMNCLNSQCITEFDEEFDIFLFNDTGEKPNKSSIFFRNFVCTLFKQKGKFDFKLILHKGSKWTFDNYFRSDGTINNDYKDFSNAILWLKSLPMIQESHIPDSIYDKELKDIAIKIGQPKENYKEAIENLDKNFIDLIEDTRVNDIYKSIYNSIGDNYVNSPDNNINSLLIWDNNRDFVEKFRQDLGIIFSNDVVFSLDELKQNQFILEKDAIIVLLDTNIKDNKRIAFYGLEIIKYLRKEKRFKGLIVAYSIYDEKYFKRMKNAEILFTSGIRLKRFTQEEFDGKEIERLILNVPKLSDDLLDDIIFSSFDSKGRVHEYLHNLKNDLNIIDRTGDLASVIKAKKIILDKYKELLQREIDPLRINKFNNLFESLKKEIETDIQNNWTKNREGDIFTYTNAGSQISKFSNQIADFTPISDDTEYLDKETRNWEVLFLDDKEDIREIVYNFFKEKNVICHLAATKQEVYQKLKENTSKVSLFLTDIRLLDENEHWEDRQGYDIIEQLHQDNDCPPLVYSVLTSKKGTIHKMVQKKRSYDILWFTKEDVINNFHSFSIFFDLIQIHAQENYYRNNVFQPNYKYWNCPYKGHYTFPLKSYYRYHRESKDYSIEEAMINKKTLEWILGTGSKSDWMSKLTKNCITDSEVKNFRATKLLGRRVALALAMEELGVQGHVVYERMTGNTNTSNKDSSVKVFFSKLALSPNLEKMISQAIDYFKGRAQTPGILFEEYEFLKTEYFEELLDTYHFGEEGYEFLKFVEIIEKSLGELHITIPPLLIRIKTILDKDGTPSIKRLDDFADFLKESNKTNKLYAALKKIQSLKINYFQNEIIRRFFQRAELIV